MTARGVSQCRVLASVECWPKRLHTPLVNASRWHRADIDSVKVRYNNLRSYEQNVLSLAVNVK